MRVKKNFSRPTGFFTKVLESTRHFHHQLCKGISAVISAPSILVGVSLQLTCGVEKLSVRALSFSSWPTAVLGTPRKFKA